MTSRLETEKIVAGLGKLSTFLDTAAAADACKSKWVCYVVRVQSQLAAHAAMPMKIEIRQRSHVAGATPIQAGKRTGRLLVQGCRLVARRIQYTITDKVK